jgi:hypothetical protein
MTVSPEQVADAILAKLKAEHHTFWIDPEIHSEQHEFLKTLIEERAEKLARRKAIQDKIAGSLILSGILLLIGFIGSGFMDYIRAHLK